jgi:hypothetical protein
MMQNEQNSQPAQMTDERILRIIGECAKRPNGYTMIDFARALLSQAQVSQPQEPHIATAAFDRLSALNESNAARIIELEEQMVGTLEQAAPAAPECFDFHAHLARQAAWSAKTFGPGPRTAGVCDHIRKELREIEADPTDLCEWIDVVILALDGAWRCGGTPEQIINAIVAKQTKNEGRNWPDWRTADPNKAIEHDRTGETSACITTLKSTPAQQDGKDAA